MKKVITAFAFFIPFFAMAQKPATIKKYKPKMAIYILGGQQNNKNFDPTMLIYGIEISLQCPLINTGKNSIRQHFRLVRNEGENLKSTTLEINPQYNFIDKPSFSIGIGPGAGIIMANAGETHKSVFSYGLGISSVYSFKKISIGIEICTSRTKKVSISSSKYESAEPANLNNLKSFLKIGYRL